MKYVEYTNITEGCGIGNQFRALFGAYMLSKYLGREFYTTNKWVGKLFNSEFYKSESISGSNIVIKNKEIIFEYIDSEEYSNIDVIKINGGTDIMEYLKNDNPEKLMNMTNNIQYLKYASVELSKILGEFKENVIEEVYKKVSFGIKDEFTTVQFRSFYDVGNKNMDNIQHFIEYCDEKLGVYTGLNIFITSDNKIATKKIKDRLSKKHKIHTTETLIKHSANDYSLDSVSDWILMSTSNSIISSGTSYAKVAAFLSKCDLFIKNKSNEGYVFDVINAI